MKSLITSLITFTFLIYFNPSSTIAQETLDISSHHDKVKSGKLRVKKYRLTQFGVSLRSSVVNLNYKIQVESNTIFRASLRVPRVSFRQINSNENYAIQNLGIAFGLEKNISTSRVFDIYAGAELGTNIDASSNFIRSSFTANAIVGVTAKVSENIYFFGELQPGLELRGRSNFRDMQFRSSRAINLGIMWDLNTKFII